MIVFILRDCQGQAADIANRQARGNSTGPTASLFFNSATSAINFVVARTTVSVSLLCCSGEIDFIFSSGTISKALVGSGPT